MIKKRADFIKVKIKGKARKYNNITDLSIKPILEYLFNTFIIFHISGFITKSI